jgi:cell division protein FtsN
MSPILFADNFLAGSLLTILLPLGVLIAIAIWYVVAVRHVPEETPVSSLSLPKPEVVSAASPPASESAPPEPPTGQP